MCLAYIDIYATSHNIEKVVAKRSLIKEKAYMLQHKRLGHISRKRVKRLIKDNIFLAFDFNDQETCIDYCRGRLTKIKKKEAIHSSIFYRSFKLISVDRTHLRFVTQNILLFLLMTISNMVICS